jgi:UTP:GlnB (protein PII) uridylyltransferase
VITHALASAGLSVEDAVLATWPDGAVLDSFLVRSDEPPDAEQLRRAIDVGAEGSMTSAALPDAELSVDQQASPWHTVVEIRTTDRPGVLAALATAMAAAGVVVRSASMSSHDGLVIDRFEVVDRSGSKLDADTTDRLSSMLRTGTTVKRRRFGRRLAVKNGG